MSAEIYCGTCETAVGIEYVEVPGQETPLTNDGLLRELWDRIHDDEIAGHIKRYMLARVAVAIGEATCTCCLADNHDGDCCPGWCHMNDPHEIEKCDDCGRYELAEMCEYASRRSKRS